MRQPRSKKILEKSVHAALSAIEVYNKPDFKYRDETFAILMINAWELVLKARLVKEARNSLKPIIRFQPRQNRKGVLSKRRYPVLNRSGNPQTVSVGEMLERMLADSRYGLTKAFADNLYGP